MKATPYPKLFGVLMGLLLSGSAHFLSGKRRAGLKWFITINAIPIFGALVLFIPGTVAYGVCLTSCLLGAGVWIAMLVTSYRPIRRIGFLGWVILLANFLFLGNLGVRASRLFLMPRRLESLSMYPTLQKGDLLFVNRVAYTFHAPQRGDIVVFKTQGIAGKASDVYLKRIAGLPGEHIRIAPPNLLANGQPVVDPPIFRRIASARPPFVGFTLSTGAASYTDIQLHNDEYFVIGDDTPRSADSRHWGPVPRKNIIGKALRIYWPLRRVGQSLGAE